MADGHSSDMVASTHHRDSRSIQERLHVISRTNFKLLEIHEPSVIIR